MRFVVRTTIAFALAVSGCFAADRYTCTDDADCTSRDGGVCVEEACAYPSGDCPSGLRFSALASHDAGECVGERPTTETGSQSEACEGVDCGFGRCVDVDGGPTCACDPGYYMLVDPPACVEDPCSVARCFFVDADASSEGDGSREQPWRSLAFALESFAGVQQPGDHVLLRRGAAWDESLAIDGAVGGEGSPVVFGAYGPLPDGLPSVVRVTVANSTYVTVRDLEVDATGSDLSGMHVSFADNVVLLDNWVHGAFEEGIGVHEDVEYSVVAGNRVEDIRESVEIPDKNGIAVAHIWWEDESTDIGDHHWIIDNTIVGRTPTVEDATERGIVVANRDGSGDFKIVGNRVADVHAQGLWSFVTGWAWIVGNDLGRAADPPVGTPVDGTWHAGMLVSHGGHAMVVGNRVFDTGVPMIVGAGAGAVDVEVAHNTFHGGDGAWALWFGEVFGIFERNLVLVGGGLTVGATDFAALDALVALDNAYASPSGCTFAQVEAIESPIDFAAWQGLGFDAGSGCGPVPGVQAPATWSGPDAWDDAFFAALTPDAAWAGCEEPVGARRCDGTPAVVSVPPWTSMPDNGGIGWEGPLLVRQRYAIE